MVPYDLALKKKRPKKGEVVEPLNTDELIPKLDDGMLIEVYK